MGGADNKHPDHGPEFLQGLLSESPCLHGGIRSFGAVIPIYNSGRTASPGMEYRTASADLNSLSLDGLRGLRELLQYDKAEFRRQEFFDKTDALASIRKRLNLREISSLNITDCAVMVFNLAALITAASLCHYGFLTLNAAIPAIVALMSSYGPVIALGNLSNSLAQTLASGERVLSLLE